MNDVGPPPVDGHGKLKSRRLGAGTVWYRISHRRYGSALHFSTGSAARWNDPLDTYGVLYVADAPETAFAETFGHDVSVSYPPATDKFVTVTELTERHLYRISTGTELQLGLLQGAGLAALNLDVRLLATVDYALPQRWSRWVYDAPAALDGIIYPSRLLPDHENTALFDRCRGHLQEEDLGPLAQWQCSETGGDILDILDAQGWGLV
ncbi:RES family NAD+ phosphorylase [uncultured Thiodictyon sp.]|uniref:RES family NAD+ phosphorylase n=1 Tax=uncultured Thiodictyon sp. TaxID=1846217 RepID=UPI0025DD88E2|nr:RES family NAD+ phosphorylase [uncultured Thiodictyon sp.]